MRAKTKEILTSAGIGLLGALVGIVGTSLMNIYAEQKLKRDQITIDTFAYSSSDENPKEFHDIQMLLNNVKTYSAMDAASIRDLAALARKYPNCARTLSEECKTFMVKMINVMRNEFDAGTVSEDDLKVILDPQYNKAIQAVRTLEMN